MTTFAPEPFLQAELAYRRERLTGGPHTAPARRRSTRRGRRGLTLTSPRSGARPATTS